MPKYTVTAEYSASWTETHQIEIPDGLSGDALNAWLDKHAPVAEPGPHDIECESMEVAGYAVALPDTTLQPVPDAAWIPFNGARWATDRACLIREGSPMPSRMGSAFGRVDEWVTSGVSLSDLAAVSGDIDHTKPHPGVFDGRFAPVFDGAIVTGAGLMAPAGVFRDGQMVAIVMPMRDGEAGAIRAPAGVTS